MLIGQTFYKGLVAYTEWAPRQGNSGIFGVEVVDATAAVTLAVQVEHRNRTDTSASNAGSALNQNGAGIKEQECADLKEFWRYKVTVGGTNSYDWTHMRLLQPMWRPN